MNCGRFARKSIRPSRFARTKVNSPDDKQHYTTRLYIRDAVSEALIVLLRLLKRSRDLKDLSDLDSPIRDTETDCP